MQSSQLCALGMGNGGCLMKVDQNWIPSGLWPGSRIEIWGPISARDSVQLD